MSFENWSEEDPFESYDRAMDDVNDDDSGVDRKCIKCGEEFKSKYPKACAECGGWTNEIK